MRLKKSNYKKLDLSKNRDMRTIQEVKDRIRELEKKRNEVSSQMEEGLVSISLHELLWILKYDTRVDKKLGGVKVKNKSGK